MEGKQLADKGRYVLSVVVGRVCGRESGPGLRGFVW